MDLANVSVVIPSRLQRMEAGCLLLSRSITSIVRGTILPKEILIGLDAGVRLESGDAKQLLNLIKALGEGKKIDLNIVNWPGRGHQGATNAAASMATGKYLAMLEDDDEWHKKRLESTIEAIEKVGCEFVSCSQKEREANGRVSHNDFPTASGYLMPMEVWRALGGFDEEYKIHHDGAFLGKLNARRIGRIHICEAGAKIEERPWLKNVARYARVMHNCSDECLVVRHRNQEGVMSSLEKDAERAEQSRREYEAQRLLFGYNPW